MRGLEVGVKGKSLVSCGETYRETESGEEYMLVDKEAIYCQFDILLELYELLWNLHNTLRHTLAIPMVCGKVGS